MAEPLAVEQARSMVIDAVEALPPEAVPLSEAQGRVLAEAVSSPMLVPPFESSAMDGFAVPAGAEGALRITGESRAGHPHSGTVEAGTAVRISTGAVVPEGTAAVVQVERVEEADGVVRVPRVDPGTNVRGAGDDIGRDQQLLGPGTVLGPAALGVLASVGATSVLCAPAPRVAVLATGDELTTPGSPLEEGRIYSSNGPALAALVRSAGAQVVLAEDVADTAAATRDALGRALAAADLVCVSGGVSVGPHDHVKGALAELGVEERFWRVALKPGKPTWFGTGSREGRALPCFGLPGNPVSAMVTFLLFARPALRALQGADPGATRVRAELTEPVERLAERTQMVRCRLESGPDGWRVTPTGPQGSHQLTSMLEAGALAIVPPGKGELARGDTVEAELIP